MKSMKFLVLSAFMLLAFSVVTLGQAPTPLKVGVINSQQFYLKDKGIKKLETEYKKLQTEFKVDEDGLIALQTRITNLQKEIQSLLANKSVPVKQEDINKKRIDLEKLSKEFNFKKDDYETRFKRRQAELINPVINDIYKKIEVFATSKGYDMIFDTNKVVRDGSVMYVKSSIDVTTAFIAYYNAQPAATASN